jgi:tetratricopeptide (TPR) repeat protein
LVLLIALWLFQRARSQNRDYTALVNQYVQPYPKLPVFADSVVLPNAMVEGLRAFEGRQFGTAIDQLLRIPSSSPHHRLSQYYLGVALLAEGRYQAANEALEQASEVNAWQAREPAQFFLALSLMGQGLPEAACTWINPVGYHANTRYSKSARELYGRFCP